ncbi:uncharacterized protein LOC119739488 isoform X1 [Patiria miniata]|uniref:Tyr recombinase domain-containing protein n=1 Tax=Patiria miniata TaxID=46514 RepID=A0A914ALT0_PATMI|nr:uncharacterized protein LOC119734955 isoform X1 [Patiria miniata]XP_038070392.1 uncharacterized protein LOC119739488 isoform X1 [Patiria miniata]
MPGNRGRKRKNPRDGGQREKRPLGHHPRQTRAQARAMQTLLNPPSVANSDAAGYGPEEQRPLSSGAEVIPPEVTRTHAAATSVTATAVNAAGRPVHPQIPASQQPTPLAGNSSGASSSFQLPAAQETAAHGGNLQLGAATYTTAATPAPVAGTPPAFARPSPIYTSPPAGVVTSSPVAIPTPSAAPSGAMHPLYQQAYVSGMAPSYFTGFQGVPVAHPSTTPIPGSSTSSGQLGQPAKGYQNPSTSDESISRGRSLSSQRRAGSPTISMEAINTEALRLLGASFASSTWGTYSKGVEQFIQFRHHAGLPPLWPSPCGHIAAFIAHLSLEGLAPSTIGTYTAAAAYVHKINGWPDPTDSFIVRKMREGCRRQGRRCDPRRPITAELLEKICNILRAITSSNLEAALFCAAFSLAFFVFFRVGELTTASKSAGHERTLNFQDVWFASNDHSVLVVRLRFSKTDQRGDSVELRFHRDYHSPTCPVNMVSSYLLLRPHFAGPFFVHVDGTPLTTYQFSQMLRKSLVALGLPPQGFSPHSFRIGAATSAALNGTPVPQIQLLGRWKSQAVNLYIRPDKVLPPYHTGLPQL